MGVGTALIIILLVQLVTLVGIGIGLYLLREVVRGDIILSVDTTESAVENIMGVLEIMDARASRIEAQNWFIMSTIRKDVGEWESAGEWGHGKWDPETKTWVNPGDVEDVTPRERKDD